MAAPKSIFRQLSDPRALNYTIMAAASLAIYFMMMSSRGNDIGGLICVILGVAGVVARWVAAPIMMLILTSYLLFDPGFLTLIEFVGTLRWLTQRGDTGFEVDVMFLAAGFVGYTIAHFRLYCMTTQAMPFDPMPNRAIERPATEKRPTSLVVPDEVAKIVMVLVGCLIVAHATYFVMRGLERESPFAVVYGPRAGRFFFTVWTIIGGTAVVGAIVRLICVQYLSRSEAELILRDAHFHETRRETDRIYRWRLWYKNKVANRRMRGTP